MFQYPFPFQDLLIHGLGLLIAALVVMILVIVLGFNRDELISRISDTAPNRLKLDQTLVSGLLTYIVPLVGARRRDRLTEALGALNVALTSADLASIEQAVPKGAAAGDRYAAAQMAHTAESSHVRRPRSASTPMGIPPIPPHTAMPKGIRPSS